MEQLIHSIRYNEGKFPLKEIHQIIERKEESIPYLLQILRELNDDYEKFMDNPSRIDFIYAYFLLAQFRVKELFPVMIDLLSKPRDICEEIFDDAMTEGMNRVLASVYDGEIDLLLGLIENTEANEYARGQALSALVIMVFNGQLSREFVMDYLKQLMNGRLTDTNYYINAEIVCCCEDLYPEEVYADIKRLYDDQIVESMIIGIDSIDKTLMRTKENVLKSNREKDQFQLISDAIMELQGWACFQQDKFDKFDYSFPEIEQSTIFGKPQSRQAVKTEKIGRNEPCPCNSGLKYKKCCGK